MTVHPQSSQKKKLATRKASEKYSEEKLDCYTTLVGFDPLCSSVHFVRSLILTR